MAKLANYEKDFQQLVDQLNVTDIRQLNAEGLLHSAIEFLKDFQSAYTSAGPDKQDEIIKKMEGMHRKFEEATHKLSQATGISEAYMKSFTNNPNNFSQEEWKELGQFREEINSSLQQMDQIAKEAKRSAGKKQKKTKEKWIAS